MPRIYTHEDLSGQKFGRWLVLGKSETRRVVSGRALITWICQCDCGTIREIPGSRFKKGHSQSCGCLREERRLVAVGRPPLHAAVTIQYAQYRSNAKDRGFVWELTKKEVADLSVCPCVYCGDPPSSMKTNSLGNSVGMLSGLDRVDSSRVYEPGNVVPCCWVCNKAKGTMPQNDFTYWIDRLVDFRLKQRDSAK